MIPRRRIDISVTDLTDLLHSLCVSDDAARRIVAEFECAATERLGGVAAKATASGRDALDLILDGLGLRPGDEIVVPAYTLGELVQRLRLRGFALRAADIDPDSFCVTPATVARAVSARTRAILALHTFGAPCDMTGLAALARERGLYLIEDCAHAFGARIAGRPVGGSGTAALFSMEVAKPVATFGGGLLATSDHALLERVAGQLDGRRRTPWPAARKTILKLAEELAVRSPAYGLAARMLFSERRAGGFERLYREAHDRVRTESVAYSAVQARRGLRRLEGLAARTASLNRIWRDLAAALPVGFRAQERDRWGEPAAYNFVALYHGSPAALRRAAQARGLDLAIGGEVLDDVAAMLGQEDCPYAAKVHAAAVGIPLHGGIDDERRRRIGRILAEVNGA